MRGAQMLVAAAVALGGLSAFSAASATLHSITRSRVRAQVRSRVRGTDHDFPAGAADPSMRALLLVAGLSDNARFVSLAKLLAPIVGRFDSKAFRDVESTRRAGLDGLLPEDRIQRAKLACSVLAAVSTGALIGSSVFEVAFSMAGGAIVGFRFPSWAIRRLAAKRVACCVADLPEMIDMIAMGSEAGLSFDAACALYCERHDSPLAHEMSRAASFYRTGSMSRESALLDLADRLECEPVGRFVSSTVQSLKLGAPLAEMLTAQADNARRAYRAQLEERIAKAPVKMLVPMGTLILPAMMMLVLGPVVVGMSSGAGV